MKTNMMKIFSIIFSLFLFGCSIEINQKDLESINKACSNNQGFYMLSDRAYSKYAIAYCKDGEYKLLNSFKNYEVTE